MSAHDIFGDGFVIVKDPVPNWQWCFNGDWYALTVSLTMERPPNWFHRLMQRLILGIHWRKV